MYEDVPEAEADADCPVVRLMMNMMKKWMNMPKLDKETETEESDAVTFKYPV